MIESVLELYSNIELIDILVYDDYIELTLHDYLNKEQEFEQEVSYCVNDFKKSYKNVEFEFYIPKEEQDEGYELAFIKLFKEGFCYDL